MHLRSTWIRSNNYRPRNEEPKLLSIWDVEGPMIYGYCEDWCILEHYTTYVVLPQPATK